VAEAKNLTVHFEIVVPPETLDHLDRMVAAFARVTDELAAVRGLVIPGALAAVDSLTVPDPEPELTEPTDGSPDA